MQQTILPQWLENFRVDDVILAAGYEAVPAQFRAALKTGLAFSQSFYGEAHDFMQKSFAGSASGFSCHASSCPASFALTIFPASYASAPRLAAVFALARLAGVRNIAAVSLAGPPTPQACAALELAGVEDIFTLDQEGAIRATYEMQALFGSGRMAVLGASQVNRATFQQLAEHLDLPCFFENKIPTLKIQEGSGHNQAIIAWAQPDALKASSPDVFYCAKAAGEAPLEFLPGLEACWIHRNLELNFFRNISIAAGTYSNDQALPQNGGPIKNLPYSQSSLRENPHE